MSNIIPFPSMIPTIEARYIDDLYAFFALRPHGDGKCMARLGVGEAIAFATILRGRGWDVIFLNEVEFDEP